MVRTVSYSPSGTHSTLYPKINSVLGFFDTITNAEAGPDGRVMPCRRFSSRIVKRRYLLSSQRHPQLLKVKSVEKKRQTMFPRSITPSSFGHFQLRLSGVGATLEPHDSSDFGSRPHLPSLSPDPPCLNPSRKNPRPRVSLPFDNRDATRGV